jgi:hypothetical protein
MEVKIIRNKLSNDFPSIYIKEIDKALKIHKTVMLHLIIIWKNKLN